MNAVLRIQAKLGVEPTFRGNTAPSVEMLHDALDQIEGSVFGMDSGSKLSFTIQYGATKVEAMGTIIQKYNGSYTGQSLNENDTEADGTETIIIQRDSDGQRFTIRRNQGNEDMIAIAPKNPMKSVGDSVRYISNGTLTEGIVSRIEEGYDFMGGVPTQTGSIASIDVGPHLQITEWY